MASNSVRPRAVDVLFGDAPSPTAPPLVRGDGEDRAEPIVSVVTAQPAPRFVQAPIPAAPAPPSPSSGQPAPRFIQAPPPPTYAVSPTRLSRGGRGTNQPAPLDALFGLTDPSQPPRLAPVPAATISRDQSQYALYVSDMIRNMYEQVAVELADSPSVSEFCMGILLKAREAYQRGNFPLAEYYAESVDVKLKRSARSVKASTGLGVWLLWLWQLGMLGLGGFLIGITYVPNLMLLGVLVNSDLMIGMRIVGWGVIGGVLSAVYNMPRYVQFREYDPAYAMNYFSRPLQGLLAGALIFLATQTFFNGAPKPAPGDVPTGPIAAYFIAALVGFGQQYVWEFFDSILRAIFRSPPSSGLTPPRPPA